jgi:hypothetical protein
MSLAAMVNGGAGVIKRQALTLKNDPEGNGKYVSGLKDVRVRSREVSIQWFLDQKSVADTIIGSAIYIPFRTKSSSGVWYSRKQGIFAISRYLYYQGCSNT